MSKQSRKGDSKQGGAVTLDWIVLMAAMIGLLVAVFHTVSSGSPRSGSASQSSISSMSVIPQQSGN
jgi:hypothetical protein